MRSHVKDGLGLRQTWDLGPYAAVLAHGILLLQQQNTKKLYGTKNNCVHAQLGWILDKGYKETQKPNHHIWKSLEKKQPTTVHSPAQNTTD